ncbi:MAG: glycosyltransferase family 2 protein [Anaerolineae bacterium]|nr:glycosyltransferase family 2 protein [Anaerolineae bacterium]
MTRLTAIILTYNEAENIKDCLDSLTFADTRIVFDSGSSDDTVDIARQAGAQVIRHDFENFAAQRNAALKAVETDSDWVLFVDADERVTPELAEEVRQVIINPRAVGYRIPRYNYIFGKLTKGAGWYPDYQTRLLRVGRCHYDPERPVHEIVLLDGEEDTLQNHFIHYNYKDMRQFIAKQRKYVQFDAQIMFEQDIKPKPQNYILQPLRHFSWRFFELKGYQEGWHGFRLSAVMAWYEFRKYQLLGGLWRKKG